MIMLVLGPNGSGKSACAEKLAARLSSGVMYYVATMIPYGEEGQNRVEKHRKQRESMGFITVEKPFCVSEISFTQDSVTLLEDVSNLLSNALFAGNCDGDVNSVFNDVTAMCGACRDAVLVSIDGLTALLEYDGETREYIKSLNRLNDRLIDFADTVVTMRGGLPVLIKGGAYEMD